MDLHRPSVSHGVTDGIGMDALIVGSSSRFGAGLVCEKTPQYGVPSSLNHSAHSLRSLAYPRPAKPAYFPENLRFSVKKKSSVKKKVFGLGPNPGVSQSRMDGIVRDAFIVG